MPERIRSVLCLALNCAELQPPPFFPTCFLGKQTFVPADMEKTLKDNGIVDDDLAFEKLGMDEEGYTPVIHIYYNDDLTIA